MRYVLSGLAVAVVLAVAATHGVVVVTGSSMSPALRIGDACVYRRTLDPRPGDIVLYVREDGSRVVHRVVAVGARGELRTKGDACETPDRNLVTPADIIGTVVWDTGSLRALADHEPAYATLRNQSHSTRR